jgi:EAL domain-containing protein (putative c-di-GMP-specific phosphodiesterase class I)
MEPLQLELDELDEADAPDPVARREPDPPALAAGTQRHPIARPATPPLAVGTDEVDLAALADLEARLERCIAGMQMHFQPIVYPDRARFGYEALLRSTDKSLPHPGAILDAAERLERTGRLGMSIRAQVAKVFAAAPPERGVVFVNLHINDLFDRSLTSPFAPLTRIASRVVLEITERASLDGVGDLRYRVAELRERGFRIAIDDLGGGHARMGALGPLDTDFVKLDMSLVRAVDTHPMKQRLVRSITQLCREHGVMVIGEGVETAAEAECLTELGCDLLQGYLIARPGPPFVDP